MHIVTRGLPLAVLLALVADAASAQTLADFGFLEGEWAGYVEYVGGQDDEAEVRLATTLRCTRVSAADSADGSLSLRYVYTEPAGRKLVAEGELRVDGESGRVTIDVVGGGSETWNVMERIVESSVGRSGVVLVRLGTDDDRSADIKLTLMREGDTLTIRKEVRYEVAQGWRLRSEYRLEPSS